MIFEGAPVHPPSNTLGQDIIKAFFRGVDGGGRIIGEVGG